MKRKLLLVPAILFMLLLMGTPGFLSAKSTVTGVKLDIKVYLKGALVGNGLNTPLLMRDDLRSGGYLPVAEPYSAFPRYQHVGADGGNETISSNAVLAVTGANAIVDWVFIELRNAANPAEVLATRSALLQRDGNVVDVDGVSFLSFPSMPAGNYYVAVRHRNHLSVMSNSTHSLGNSPVSLDFTDPKFKTWGASAQQEFMDKMAMRAGDFNQDGRIIYMGPNNDIFQLFSSVLSAPENVNFSPNYILYGYHNCDYNMDGRSIFIGPNNDRSPMLYYSLGECLGNHQPNCILVEDFPK